MFAVEGVEPTSTPVHQLLADGSFAITVPCDGILAGMALAAGTAGLGAVLEMTDYAPLPLREPVRSLVWIRGRLHGVPVSEVAALLDLIAAKDPNPALLQVNSDSVADTRYALMRLEIESVEVADARRSRAGCSTWSRHITRSSTGWRPGCRCRCAAAGSDRLASTATGCNCGSKTTKAITMCGCRSPNRSTT
jgi:hypothetical protein